MSEKLQKYQTAFLDEGTGETATRSETITVTVFGDGGFEEDLEVEVRSLGIGEYQTTGFPEACVGDDGQVLPEYGEMQADTLVSVHLLQKCCYIPGTDQRVFDESEHAKHILDAPFREGGWVQRLFKAVAYVHGQRKVPPEGIESPHLQRIEQAARDLGRIARAEGEELNPGEVADIATRIANYAQHLDQGGDAGNLPTH